MEAPIPQPRLDDDEDVHWALSTAGALWGRGERAEALKWLRRAAEQASDVNADKRALELFKAAADVANQVKAASAPPPAPAPSPPPSAEAAPRTPAPPPAPPQRPSIPARPGSVFPPAAPSPRPASVPAPARATPSPGPVIPGTPRPPSPSIVRDPPPPPARSAPPPPPSAAQRPPPPPVRPALPVTPPAQPVAIAAAKPAPQALTPKRRRSFTGEGRPEKVRAADGARARHDGHKPHRKRTHGDDELHLPQQPQSPASSSIWDDLDEDTRVISGKAKGGDELEQALSRLREAPPPPEPTRRDVRSIHEELTSDGTRAPGAAPMHEVARAQAQAQAQAHGQSPTQTLTQTHAHAPAQDGPQSRTAPGLSSATERPPPAPALQAAPKRLDTLPALRVAVLGTGIAGEVRLISLDAGDEPPPGAAVAVLVPMSAADGEAVARLFGGLE